MPGLGPSSRPAGPPACAWPGPAWGGGGQGGRGPSRRCIRVSPELAGPGPAGRSRAGFTGSSPPRARACDSGTDTVALPCLRPASGHRPTTRPKRYDRRDTPSKQTPIRKFELGNFPAERIQDAVPSLVGTPPRHPQTRPNRNDHLVHNFLAAAALLHHEVVPIPIWDHAIFSRLSPAARIRKSQPWFFRTYRS